MTWPKKTKTKTCEIEIVIFLSFQTVETLMPEFMTIIVTWHVSTITLDHYCSANHHNKMQLNANLNVKITELFSHEGAYPHPQTSSKLLKCPKKVLVATCLITIPLKQCPCSQFFDHHHQCSHNQNKNLYSLASASWMITLEGDWDRLTKCELCDVSSSTFGKQPGSVPPAARSTLHKGL